jgi:sugar lactone lactonase YvrE
MSAIRIEVVGDTRDRLGECPLWDTRDACLYWIDSKGPYVRKLNPASGERRDWTLPSDVGSIALAKPGWLLCALKDGLYSLELGSGRVQRIATIEHAAPDIRLNDGRTDRQGRFVVGSMVHGRHATEGALYRLDRDGTTTRLASGIALTNSTCFSPDGRTLYYSDSLAGEVRASDYDPASGAIGRQRILVDTRQHGSGPDGAVVDAEGHVWVALVLAGKLGRYRPDGSLERLVDMPTPFPTCPGFGGPNLDVLYVTSARDSGNVLKSDHPDAGALFAVHGLGVRGLPEVPYAGAMSGGTRT